MINVGGINFKPADDISYYPAWSVKSVSFDYKGKRIIIKHPNVMINRTKHTIDLELKER